MPYDYKTERPDLFTDQGQRQFLSIRDRVHNFLKLAGAIRLDKAIANQSGDSWTMLACVDRLVELGEIREITKDEIGQHRVFVSTREA